MADYGLKIFDAAGNIKLDATDRITRLRYSTVAAAGANGSVTLADIDGKKTCEFGLALSARSSPHCVTRNLTTISWTAEGNWYFPSSNTLVVVFLYT